MSKQNENNSRASEEKESGIFDEPKPRYTAKSKHKDDFKRQMKLFLTVALIAAAAVLAYFFVIKPLVEYTEQLPEEKIELLEGEQLGPQNRIFIMEYLKNDNISSVDVHNEYGEWGVVYDTEAEQFYIKDHPSASYDKQMLQSLLSAAGYTLAIERITAKADNLGEYGLSELDNPAWYVICDKSGNSHKLYIGDIIPSNAGYYVRYDGRDAVYVLDYTIAETLLSPLESIIDPTLAFPVTSGSYHTINNFAIKRGGELFLALEYVGENKVQADGLSSVHRFLFPAEYVPGDSKYLDVFSKFQDFSGMSTLVYNPDMQDLVEYGLDQPEYDLYFEYMGIPNNIIFSKKNTSDNYYAYSPVFDLITEVAGENASWLEWDLIEWIERPIFQMSISSIDTIELSGDGNEYRFKLTSDENGLASVREEISGRNVENLFNFKKFYQSILMTNLQDYAGLDNQQKNALVQNGEYMKLVITTVTGEVTELKFYPYETRRSYYTINGRGDFYILRDRMVKLLDDAAKVMEDKEIIPDANN